MEQPTQIRSILAAGAARFHRPHRMAARQSTVRVSLKAPLRQAIVTSLSVDRRSLVIYRVTARFRTDTAAELRRRLDDGSIAAQ